MSLPDPDVDQTPEGAESASAETDTTGEDSTATEDEYAQGRTSDPDGATRDEPAGEDYAGSGF